MCKFICYIFCLSGRAVMCIVYLAGDTIAALRTSALAMASAIAFMAVHSAREQRPLLGTWCSHKLRRIVCWLLIVSAEIWKIYSPDCSFFSKPAPSSADSTDRALLPIRGCPQTTDFATTASAILEKVAPLTQHVLYYKNKHGTAILKDCNSKRNYSPFYLHYNATADLRMLTFNPAFLHI